MRVPVCEISMAEMRTIPKSARGAVGYPIYFCRMPEDGFSYWPNPGPNVHVRPDQWIDKPFYLVDE
jgi:hypothetical protein